MTWNSVFFCFWTPLKQKAAKQKAARRAAEDIEEQALKILESMENAKGNATNQKKKELSMKELRVPLQFHGEQVQNYAIHLQTKNELIHQKRTK